MDMKDDVVNVVGLSSNKPKGKTNWKVMGAIIGIVVLAVGVISGIVLVRQNQNIEEKAACVASCVNGSKQLNNCYQTADTNGDASNCNIAGRIEVCGQTATDVKQFCCSTAGGKWSTDLTLCPASSPTPTATATATSTATATTVATSTSTSTSKATATSTTRATTTAKATSTTKATTTTKSTSTAVPIPVTGVEWPTMLGATVGIIMILASLSLAI